MRALFNWQRDFLSAVINDAVELTHLDINAEHGDIPNPLAIHRNNWRSNLYNALRVTYPVVQRLVGDEFFQYAANGFIDAYPSRSANLEDYGKQFAEFLRSFAAAQSLPYLADVAALEAAIETVLVAADHEPVACPLYSPFPVLRIWQINQPGWADDDTVTLDAGADYLLIHRIDNEVLIEPIEASRFNALQNYL